MLETILIKEKEFKVLYVFDISGKKYYGMNGGFLLIYNLHPSKVGDTAKINELIEDVRQRYAGWENDKLRET